jgi:ferredoxin
MVVAEIKPLTEIKEMVKKFKKILVLGCGDCVSVCLSGGKKQVELLASALRTAKRMEGDDITIGEKTILRQCEPKFIDQIIDDASGYDAVVSMACGAGVQALVEKIASLPVLPAMNTRFIGVSNGEGDFLEMCSACGECIISETGGICPVTRCAKGLMNGPCGGSKNGRCEASPDIPCAWILIYEKMKELGRLEDLKKIAGIKNWSKHSKPGRYETSAKEETVAVAEKKRPEKTVSK